MRCDVSGKFRAKCCPASTVTSSAIVTKHDHTPAIDFSTIANMSNSTTQHTSIDHDIFATVQEQIERDTQVKEVRQTHLERPSFLANYGRRQNNRKSAMFSRASTSSVRVSDLRYKAAADLAAVKQVNSTLSRVHSLAPTEGSTAFQPQLAVQF